MEEEVDEYGVPIKAAAEDVDEYGVPVKKKEQSKGLPSFAWELPLDGSSGLTSDRTSNVSAPTVAPRSKSTLPSASDRDQDDKDLALLKSYYHSKPPEEEPLGKIDPAKYKAMGYSQSDIKTLLDEEARTLRDDPDFYKKLNESESAVPWEKRPVDALAFYRRWATENGQRDNVVKLIQKAHTEVDISTPEKLKKYEDAVWKNGPEYVPLDTPTGLKIWEAAMGTQATILNKAFKKNYDSPDTKKKLERLNLISSTLSGVSEENGNVPKTEQEINSFNSLVEESNGLRSDQSVMEAIEIDDRLEDLYKIEKSIYKLYPSVYEARAKKIQEQKEIDQAFRKDDTGGLPVITHGVTSMFNRQIVKFAGEILKIPALFDADNEYGPSDKWRDYVDKAVDGINEDLFLIPSWYDSGKASEMKAAIGDDYDKRIKEAPEDQQPALREEMAAKMDEMGTGEWTYKDGSGNRIFRNDLIFPKLARVAGDMAPLLAGGAGAAGGLRALGVGSKYAAGTGLFMSSYVMTQDDYRKAGEEAGLSPEQASLFAHGSAALTSGLELLSPNKYLWNKTEIAERVAKGVVSGQGLKAATKDAFKFIGKETFGEHIQEFSQLAGDKITEQVANVAVGRDSFDYDPEKVWNEVFETALMTTLITAAPSSARGASDLVNRNQLYREAIDLVAENKEKYMPLLQQEMLKAGVSAADAKRIVNDVNGIRVPAEGEAVYKINGIEVDSKKMEEVIDGGVNDDLYIANDPAMEKRLSDHGMMRKAEKIVRYGRNIQGIAKIQWDRMMKGFEAEGKVTKEDGVTVFKDPVAAKQAYDYMTQHAGNLPPIPRMSMREATKNDFPTNTIKPEDLEPSEEPKKEEVVAEGPSETIKAIESQRDAEIKAAIKVEPEMNFIPDSEILKTADPRGLRKAQKDLKKEFLNLKSMMECLIK